MEPDAATPPPYPSPPLVPLQACPIATSLRFLGRRWTLTILRDIAFFPKVSFGEIRRSNPGLRQRTLSLRLQELAQESLIRKVVPPGDPRHPYYELTPKGLEVWPILAALFQFGIHNHAATVFQDGRARNLEEVYPRDADLMLGPLARVVRESDLARAAGPTNRPGAQAPTPRGTPRAPGPKTR